MKKVLLVKSSVRDGRLADEIETLVQTELANYPDFEVTVVDFKEMPLPFFNSAEIPSHDDYAPSDPNVQQWTRMVAEADAVVLLVAEYNHSYTAVLKNAIDWIYKEWHNKPIAFIGYGWAGGARAIKHLRDVFTSKLAAQVIETEANLHFQKEIEREDATPINEAAVKTAINDVLQALI